MKIQYFIIVILAAFVSTIDGKVKKENHSNISMSDAKRALLKKKHHLDLINFLIDQRNYKTYLEIGVADGANLRAVKALHKIGVDPSPVAPCTHQITSDEFFRINQETFDIIFIDGLHICEQVLKDVDNSLKCLNPGGIIVMHDCMPQTPEQQSRTPIAGAWNGDVWKAAAYIRMHFQDVHFCVLDMDWGCGILTPNSSQTLYPAIPIEEMNWTYYVNNKNKLLNVTKVENWVKTIQ